MSEVINPTTVTTVEIEAMSLADLRKLATSVKLPGRSGLDKAALRSALIEYFRVDETIAEARTLTEPSQEIYVTPIDRGSVVANRQDRRAQKRAQKLRNDGRIKSAPPRSVAANVIDRAF